MATRKVFEGVLTLDCVDDGGTIRVADVACKDDPSQLGVKILSEDEGLQHAEMKQFEGKQVRVTLEVIE